MQQSEALLCHVRVVGAVVKEEIHDNCTHRTIFNGLHLSKTTRSNGEKKRKKRKKKKKKKKKTKAKLK
jgi:hypothetical protein